MSARCVWSGVPPNSTSPARRGAPPPGRPIDFLLRRHPLRRQLHRVPGRRDPARRRHDHRARRVQRHARPDAPRGHLLEEGGRRAHRLDAGGRDVALDDRRPDQGGVRLPRDGLLHGGAGRRGAVARRPAPRHATRGPRLRRRGQDRRARRQPPHHHEPHRLHRRLVHRRLIGRAHQRPRERSGVPDENGIGSDVRWTVAAWRFADGAADGGDCDTGDGDWTITLDGTAYTFGCSATTVAELTKGLGKQIGAGLTDYAPLVSGTQVFFATPWPAPGGITRAAGCATADPRPATSTSSSR